MRSGFWRQCRVIFRWLRRGALLAVLGALVAVFWFNQVGLPGFLKTRLVAACRDRGVNLEFTRLRLRLDSGIVGENVRLAPAQNSGSPSLTLAEIKLQLNFHALLRRRLQVDGLGLRQGRLSWPVSPTHALQLENIRTELRFQTNDTWTLDSFQADFAGGRLALSGEIAHASELSDWALFQGDPAAGQRAWLQDFSEVLAQVSLEGAPQLSLTVNGDARDPHSFLLQLKATAPAVHTPWFRARDVQIIARLTAPAGAPDRPDPAWGVWTNLQPYHLSWSVALTQFNAAGQGAQAVSCSGLWSAPELAVTRLSAVLERGRLEAGLRLNVATRELAFTNASSFDLADLAGWLPEKLRGRLADFRWAQPPAVRFQGAVVLPPWTDAVPDWAGEVLPTLQLDGDLALANGRVLGAAVDSVAGHFSCSNRVWQLPDLALVLGNSRLDISGSLNDATKEYRCRLQGRMDQATARDLLKETRAAHGMEIVHLKDPLAFDVTASGLGREIQSLAVRGCVAVTNIAVRGEVFGSVTATVDYTNRVLSFWQPQMHTGMQMATADSVTLDFNRRLILFTNALSTADPGPVTRAIGPKTAALVEPYHFFQPPAARVNGQIPLGDMHGGPEMALVDMRFEIIRGAPFQWERVKTKDITATLLWRGQTLLLTNAVADCYGGTASGFAYFNFRVPHEGADYNFAVDVTNLNLHALALDLWAPTNQLEGFLSGRLAVTNASTMHVRTWNGEGQIYLRDGLLWDIPIFGILSPVLNSVATGLGSSRATEAAGNFIITNGVIYTDSLLIHSTMARLEYVGTIDLQQNVDARVTAQVLRNAWGVGPLVTTVFWPFSKLFEYRVTGPLTNPKSEPLYLIPKLLLVPLHPFRTLGELLPGGDSP